MKFTMVPAAAVAAVVGAFAAAAAFAQTSPMPQAGMPTMAAGAPRTVRISYENLTTGQVFSPAVFMTHDRSAPPLFKEGMEASFGMMRIAEEGNAGPLLSEKVVPGITGPFGAAVTSISTLPGQTRTVDIEVTAEHPMLSGAWMLVMTNDGFTGIDGVDAYAMAGPTTMDLMAYEAGTERNNERAPYLVARMGTDRDPEGGVVRKHPGVRGDADLTPERRFDPERPVARITITPVMSRAAR